MESEYGESVTNKTKISDSGYSHSSNTNSHGSASTKSRNSAGSNSSQSSGFEEGSTKPNESQKLDHQKALTKRNKDREHKKKKQKALVAPTNTGLATSSNTFITPLDQALESSPSTGAEPDRLQCAVEITVPEQLENGNNNNHDNQPILMSPMPLLANNEEPTSAIAGEQIPHTWEGKTSPLPNNNEHHWDGNCFSHPNVMPSSQPEVNDGFCCVISMYDGVVLYTTPSLTSVLGFPKDTWLGHSFIDFVHPKDRETFSNHVSTSITLPVCDSQGKIKDVKNYMYVCLRRHASVKSTGTNPSPVPYQAFHLTVTIKQLTDSPETRLCDHNNGCFLVIIAVPVYSAYKVPGERKKSTKFGMRHTAACNFSYVDPDVVTSFGFLPQDMLGKSVFDFYHPEDMPLLKEIYKSIMDSCQTHGSVYRSKPYRFLVQNGCFAMIETEWSSVINPWTRRLEFVISLHQVLQGPMNPNVFDVTSHEEYKIIPEETIKQSKLIQTEILQFLTEEVPRPVEIGKQEVSKRCRDLANFMESLTNTSKLHIDVGQALNRSLSERDSVMLGEISPHHDFYDSKSSSETPPSYNQLNYNENINRFFQSNPKTTVTSDESNSASNAMDTDGKTSQDCVPNNQKYSSPLQNSRTSGCDSAGNLSSSSNRNMESSTSGTNTSNDDYKPPHLTESVLVRHNEDMEKIMIQKHKKERFSIKDRGSKKANKNLEKYAKDQLSKEDTNEHSHGIKRSGSYSWDKDCHKISKMDHQSISNQIADSKTSPLNIQQQANMQHILKRREGINNLVYPTNDNVWPQFTMVNEQCNSGMLPFYYMPALIQPSPIANKVESMQRYQVHYMPAGLLYNYNPMFIPQTMLCPTVPMVPVSVQNTSPSSVCPDERQFGNDVNPKVHPGPNCSPNPALSGNSETHPCDQQQQQFGNSAMCTLRSDPQCDRPASQATSVKAEPGSRMGSIASASVVNKALSECSRKDLGSQSVCSPGTPMVSPPDDETQAEQFSTTVKVSDTTDRSEPNKYRINRMDEDSSCYSSSYSSLLKTDTGSGSNDDSSTFNKIPNRANNRILKQQKKIYPIRKKDPPWVESVSVSSDMIYRYQMATKDLQDTLKADLNTLKKTQQPIMVNDQLHQLYIEMELEGLSKALTLEEGFSSSSSSSDEINCNNNSNASHKPRRKNRSYSSLMMIYEENAPLPPPEANS